MVDEPTVINMFLEVFGQPRKLFSEIGDDVAWTKKAVKRDKFAIKADMLVGKTDMPKGMSLRQAARKSVVACVSDFACKGVKPWGMLVSIGLPKGFNEEHVLEIANGLKDARNEFDIEIVGGDTNEASDLVIDCIMFGWGKNIVSRDGAYVDEYVLVTGDFGLPPLGVDILSERKKIRSPRLTEKAIESVLYPRPRLNFGLIACNRKLITAAIDSSDGLAISLYELAQRSHVDILLDELPINETLKNNNELSEKEKREYTLYGGEEYEIVFTCKIRDVPKVLKVGEETNTPVRIIGRTVEGNGKVFFKGEIVERRGWTHLKG
ncbi:MAG: thiamine-phosphate kinase [Nitrososphaeria archaeon]